ncbi:NUDIX hydrolase [Ferdinandcohnia quinoae]|uniref:NUDIX hydrolase n=1 Tax=Fredinandcohnia quinoae TaxID=2918902 RepID=UPI0031F5D3E3
MGNEYFKIFDDDRNEIGVASRSDVHRLGHWHETFHCWFVTKDEGTDYLLLQLRSDTKQDYPNLFDITAAGHLLADETVQDGVREIKEEIGIDVSYTDLVSLGIIDYCALNYSPLNTLTVYLKWEIPKYGSLSASN